MLINQHVKAGCIRPSSSPYALPLFIISKTDPTVLLYWVNNYWHLNHLTISDNYPLPWINDILADCAKGRIWGKINMRNSFFQTLVHSDHVKYTMTLTPFSLWEWVVMPMGMRNFVAMHQWWVTLALKELIRKICHVYLDDIIIWSSSLDKHKKNVEVVLEALKVANLYCSSNKSMLFSTKINFLRHHISAWGIEADLSKVFHILNWLAPTTVKHVRQFLGLVRYISAFLPSLAEHTTILTPLTRKECNATFLTWTSAHQYAFDAIKCLVVSRDCLTMIDYEKPAENKISVTCNASRWQMGAVLAFRATWETAHPVAFESCQLNSMEQNYPIHKQEMLSIMQALWKWQMDLLGTHSQIYTDHKILIFRKTSPNNKLDGWSTCHSMSILSCTSMGTETQWQKCCHNYWTSQTINYCFW